MKINNRIELKTIALNHSADINYQDFKKIYRECTKEPYNFLTIDTTLPASDSLRIFIKMTLTDELKILDDKIKANQAQYDLGREAAKISALSSKDLLEKYEYLTGEDLGHRPSVLEKIKFEYSPLGAVSADNVKKKTNTNKVNIKKKQNITQHSFIKFKDIDEFKEL